MTKLWVTKLCERDVCVWVCEKVVRERVVCDKVACVCVTKLCVNDGV